MAPFIKLNKKIGVVCSAGGHLTEALFALKECKKEIFIVTFKAVYLIELLPKSKIYFVPNPFEVGINIFSMISRLIVNFICSIFIFFNEKPDTIFSTGAGVAIPFCIIGKIFGSKIIYLESGASVKEASRTGKFIYRFADHFLIQWKEQVQFYPKATYIGPLIKLVVERNFENQVIKEPKLVIGIVGTLPFQRMISTLKEVCQKNNLKLWLQTSTLKENSTGIKSKPFLSQAELLEWIKSADIVVTHGGYGIILHCLSLGKKPIVFPRFPELREHRHLQMDLVEKLSELGLVQIAKNGVELEKLIFNKCKMVSINKLKEFPDPSEILTNLWMEE